MLYGHRRTSPKEPKLTYSDPTLWPQSKAPAQEFCAEGDRLMVLASFGLDELKGDQELARIAQFAAKLCGTKGAAVSLVERERQRFLASQGLEITETPRSTSFCAHTMLGSDVLEVLDASEDSRFADFALVTGEAHLRYYAGAPLISSEGAPLGALCLTDTESHTQGLTELQREGLLVLAEAVMRRIETHRASNRATAAIESSAERLQFMLDSVPDIAWSAAPGPKFDYFNARFSEVTGVPPRTSVEDWREVIHPDDFDASSVKFAEAISTASFFEDEWRLRLADGSYRWVISRAVPSSDDPETARWFGTLTDIDDRYRISQERELLAGELAHRIKNIFAVIIGLVTLHARGDATHKAFADILSENIRALSRAQEFALQLDGKKSEGLLELLGVLMKPYGVPGQIAVSISGEDVETGQHAVTPLALVLHELATNSAKYGALSAADGTLTINVQRQEETASIIWRETGGPPANAPESTGFGSRLISMAIEHQLGGSITHDWKPDGLNIAITIPLARLAD